MIIKLSTNQIDAILNLKANANNNIPLNQVNAKIVCELLKTLNSIIDENQDKIKRRNMQIKDRDKKIEQLNIWLTNTKAHSDSITNKFNYLFGIEKWVNDKTLDDSSKVKIVKDYINNLLKD